MADSQMDFNVGHGSLLSYVLAYGWGILLFLALAASLGVGLYWIVVTLAEKIRRDEGVQRIKTIAWTVAITGAIGLCALGLLIPLHQQ
ncbi:MAG: hypothetical protein RJA35_836 [Actinomycetota bacterium]